MRVKTQGLQVTLIDFTLSRLRTPAGDVQFCNLADDPALFKGPKNDCQVASALLSSPLATLAKATEALVGVHRVSAAPHLPHPLLQRTA